MKRKKLWIMGMVLTGMAVTLTACQKTMPKTEETKKQEETILIAAAASLEYSMKEEIIPMFEKENPGVQVEGTYDSSGKLQTQIEEGMDADIFLSAATAQMNALKEEGLIAKDSVENLLENKIVFIVPKGQEEQYQSFEDIKKAQTVALGDPASVPAGQYAQESLENLGIWEEVSGKASFGTNVTEVLNWVAEGSADAGIVYSTDAATQKDKVSVVAQAPVDSLAEPVLYPVGMVEASTKKEAAELFIEFLKSEEAAQIFEAYGFTMYE